MSIIELQELPKTGVLLGIDPGSKTIGVAVSDGVRLIASPVKIIRRGKKLAPALRELNDIYERYGACGMILGLPLNMDGSKGPRYQAAFALAHNILKGGDIPIVFQDERLTSAEAERAMIDADLSRARRAESLDASAAAIILQTALDRLANSA